MNIQVFNLDSQVSADQLKNLFSGYGEVSAAEIAMDAFTDQPRGFAFVEMPEEEQARMAIAALDQQELNGRAISVAEAAPRMAHKGSYKVGSGPVKQYRFKKS